MDQVLKKAGRIPEQILGKVSIAVSGSMGMGTSGAWVGSANPGVRDEGEGNIPRCCSALLSLLKHLCTRYLRALE